MSDLNIYIKCPVSENPLVGGRYVCYNQYISIWGWYSDETGWIDLQGCTHYLRPITTGEIVARKREIAIEAWNAGIKYIKEQDVFNKTGIKHQAPNLETYLSGK